MVFKVRAVVDSPSQWHEGRDVERPSGRGRAWRDIYAS
jgi:hypothetical protein